MRRTRKNALLISVSALILIFPIITIRVLSSATVSAFLKGKLQTDIVSVLGLAFDYFSIAITLLLGVVVFIQAEKINNLEAGQYRLFVGIKDLDYSHNFGDTFFTGQSEMGFQLSHMFSTENKSLMSTIFIGEGRGTTVLIPLAFITQNNTLITAIHIKQVDVKIKSEKMPKYREFGPFQNSGAAIHTILPDKSQFVLGFGIVAPVAIDMDQIELKFYIDIANQNGMSESLVSTVSLYKQPIEGKYALTSSRSQYIN